MKTSRFYSSLGLLVILNIIIKPIWILGIDRPVQNLVGAVEYGQYFALFNLSLITSFILDPGLGNYLNRQLASGEMQLREHAASFFITRLLLSLLYALLVCIICIVTGVNRWDIIAGVILIQVLLSFFLFFRAIVTANQLFRADAWLSVLDKTLLIIIAGAMLCFPAFAGRITIDRFIILQITTLTIALLVTVILLGSKQKLFTISFRLPPGQLLKQAAPYGLIILLMTFHARADAFLLERMIPNGAEQAGIYANGYRLLDASNMLGYLAASFLLPYLASAWQRRQLPADVILKIRHPLVIFAVSLSVFSIFLAPWIQSVLYHQNTDDTIIAWCLPALIGYSLTQVYGTVLTATGHIRSFCIIVAFAVFLNLILNLILIPPYGAKGCGIAALASQSACGIVTMIHASRKLQIPLHKSSLLMYTFIGLALALALKLALS